MDNLPAHINSIDQLYYSKATKDLYHAQFQNYVNEDNVKQDAQNMLP